jgi:hypothetical protein
LTTTVLFCTFDTRQVHGGEHWVVSLPASSCAFAQLHETVLKDRRPTRAPRLKYPLPSSGVLISVATDEDVEQMFSVWEQCTSHNWMERQLFVMDKEPSRGAASTLVRTLSLSKPVFVFLFLHCYCNPLHESHCSSPPVRNSPLHTPRRRRVCCFYYLTQGKWEGCVHSTALPITHMQSLSGVSPIAVFASTGRHSVLLTCEMDACVCGRPARARRRLTPTTSQPPPLTTTPPPPNCTLTRTHGRRRRSSSRGRTTCARCRCPWHPLRACPL